ncbi:MAG: glycerol-3-phosphate dehydrogenase/oxidase [Corynebacteriales bacterium]|nr:glycerol-3-phosphate dehydrogenase/oxidase [Mycobacteriales bacterium]
MAENNARDPRISRFAASRLGPEQRARDIERLKSETFDVLVIGGGVVGAGAALDAASRGLKVALVEARDLASGTSSRATKLIHGGLRYLEQLEFHLVREALKERGLLLGELAPHLVRPVPLLIPIEHRVWQRPFYGAGIMLYDFLGTLFGTSRGMPLQKHFTRKGTRELFPSLRKDALVGSIKFHDAQVDDARFVMTLARTALAQGAAITTSTRVVDINKDEREVTGARVRDLESGEEFDVKASTVIGAVGVWSDDISEMLHKKIGLHVRASKGIHLLVPRSAISGDAGLFLFTEKSVLFCLPWGAHWLIGTTDTDWHLDRAHPAASSADIEYLLEHVNKVLERPLLKSDIEGVYAGLRPLLAGEDESTSKLSREHAVVEPMLGMMFVAGGKFTTYRVMAKDVVDVAVERLRKGRKSATEHMPLLGADGYQTAWKNRAELARRHRVSTAMVEHFLRRYGSLTVELLKMIDEDRSLAEALPNTHEYFEVEIVYAALAEGALHLDDALTRRTRISIETVHRGTECAERAAELMAGVLGWDASTRKSEVEHYLARVAAERESQQMPDDQTADAARLGAHDVRGLSGV